MLLSKASQANRAFTRVNRCDTGIYRVGNTNGRSQLAEHLFDLQSERNAQPSSPARQTNDRLTTMSIGGEQPVDHVIAEPMWNPAT